MAVSRAAEARANADDTREVEEFAEEEDAEDPERRGQVLAVVLVLATYLMCQAAVVFVATTSGFRSPLGYSDDSDLTDRTINSDRLEALCPSGSDAGERPRNASSGAVRDLESLVLDAVTDRASEGCGEACEVTVNYYVCGSGTDVVSGEHRLEKGKLVETHDSSSSKSDAQFSTFLYARSKEVVAISYGVRPLLREAAKERSGLALTIIGLKLLIPLPIAAALLAYLGLPALRRRRQGKIIACKLASELAHSCSPWLGPSAGSYAVLAGITWTTVLCYDLWSSCGGGGGGRPANGDRARDRRQFLRYSAVGWGHPALFGSVAAFCAAGDAVLVVTLVVYVFLSVLNLLFFVFTVRHVRRHNSRVLSLVGRGRRGPPAADGPYLYFRITVLTGVLSFFFEIFDICTLDFVISDSFENRRVAVVLGLSLLDKSLYFVILVCNSRVLGLLKEARKSKPAT